METSGWLVDLSTVKVEWRSASAGCGAECVTVHGVLMMPELCAGNWGSLWEYLAQVNGEK